jgi:nitronate monooxygenase
VGRDHSAFIDAQWEAAGTARVGVGFITWRLAEQPQLLDQALAHRPVAVMLSFGDPAPFAGAIKASGAALICQVQSLAGARKALGLGADVIVAQGGEAGGHSSAMPRATLTLVPEVADMLASEGPETLLLAAGGIADGRGLAAALMLGADGALVGSRFWTAAESLAPTGMKQAALSADGDGTLRTRVGDIVHQWGWTEEYSARVLRNAFTDSWHGREAELIAQLESVRPAHLQAVSARDPKALLVHVGECVGLMDRELGAAAIVTQMAARAEAAIRTAAGRDPSQQAADRGVVGGSH